MHDLGFTPQRGVARSRRCAAVVRGVDRGGLRNPPVRWLMLAAPFTGGVGIYVFYAFQPYLLQLYGDPTAYGVAGLAAAIVAGAQIVGGLLVARVRRLFRRRTDALLLGGVADVVAARARRAHRRVLGRARAADGLGLRVRASVGRSARRSSTALIPSEQRATVLSFDNLMSSAGGVVAQPALGRVADVYGYARLVRGRGRRSGLRDAVRLLARRETRRVRPDHRRPAQLEAGPV